jgi:hypothetical protein
MKTSAVEESLNFKPNEAFKEQSVWHFEMESKNYTYCNSLVPFESAIHFVFLTVSCLLRRDCSKLSVITIVSISHVCRFSCLLFH